MSYGLSICWRGPPGSGKRFALQQQLAAWAASIGQLYVVKKQLWDAPAQGGADDENDSTVSDDDEPSDKSLLPYEVSVLHWGFDISRISLKDKRYVKHILQKWGKGSQVLGQGNGMNQRCLVLYHAHLLSNESILYLQSFLEENYHDSVLWMTSEHPLPSRLSDWCVEIPVSSSTDKSLVKLPSPNTGTPILTIEDEILTIYKHWMSTPAVLSDVKKIRAIVYALLHRNIRWVEGFHQWLFMLNKIPLTQEQKLKISTICCNQRYTGSGQTVPSYRIPVLWENYLCELRNVLSPPVPVQKEVPVVKLVKKRKSKKDATNSS
jgi:hypothetical protein